MNNMSESKRDLITLEITENQIAVLTLNRPEVHNAFDEHMIVAFQNHLETLSKNASIRLLVVRANGKNFCAGADLQWMRRMAKFSHNDNVKDATALAILLKTLYEFPKPTICLVHGVVYGGGVGIACACDMIIASDTAKFSFTEVKLGLIPAVISPYVVETIGVRHAKTYFLTTEIIDASKALELGLAHLVVPELVLHDLNASYILQLLRNGPQAMCEVKKLINAVKVHPPGSDAVVKITATTIANIRASTEGIEGVQAFLEKRQAKWVLVKNQYE